MLPNLYLSDVPFQRLMERVLSGHFPPAHKMMEEWGEVCARDIAPLSDAANKNQPQLLQYDKHGNRVDNIVFHPSYLEMKKIAYGSGLVALQEDAPEQEKPWKGSYLFRLALGYIFSQAESGLYCPICMTDGALRVLKKFASGELQKQYIPRLAARDMETLYQGAMFLTEKEGGSDVGRTQTVARKTDEQGAWKLYGDKWFCSSVDSEVILTLARPENAPAGTKGLGLFLLPKYLDGNRRNDYRINRLKNKLGTVSMPTGEVTLDGAVAYEIGNVQKGFSYMAEMLNLSRLYNSAASCAGIRRAYLESLTHAKERVAFGKPIIGHPLLQRDLVWMALELEAANAVTFQVAAYLDGYDRHGKNHLSYRILRLLTPLTKYMTAEIAVKAASKAVEILGGNGYIEDFVTARLLRDAQVLPVWEGTTNILVLDTVRAIMKEDALSAFQDDVTNKLSEIRSEGLGEVHDLAKQQADGLKKWWTSMQDKSPHEQEFRLREFTDKLYRLYTALLMAQQAQWEIGRFKDTRGVCAAKQYARMFLSGQPPYIEPSEFCALTEPS